MPDSHPDGHDDYEYRGLIAQSWDLLRGDTSQWTDRAYYHARIQESGQPALDVGCGTGRLLLDYLSEGMDIDGVDNSPEMLALCREKAAGLGLSPTLHQQTMESLDLPRRYRTIIVPSSSFQLIVDTDLARETMRRFHTQLEPGGVLIMALMVLWTPQSAEQTKEWHKVVERERPDGALVRRWCRVRYDVERRLEHTEDRYEVILDGQLVQTERHRRSPAGRWYTQEESLALYHQAGFTDVRAYSEFTTDPVRPDDRIWTMVGKRA